MKQNYLLMKNENVAVKKWMAIKDNWIWCTVEMLLTYLNNTKTDYVVLYDIENEYDYDNDCYYLDKVWKEIMEA